MRSRGIAVAAHELADLSFATDVARALGAHEFAVYYQPIVALDTQVPVGAEALVRWHHPELGLVLPGAFIPTAEVSGLIGRIGAWVLREACSSGSWVPPELGLAVNVSVLQLVTGGLGAADISEALSAAGLQAAQLTLEVSEAAMVEDLSDLRRPLEAIRELGVRVALDDFGVGNSSLQRLAELPIDTVKVDKWFTQRLDHLDSARTHRIVAALIDLASGLGYTVIAEGIETREQAAALTALGCRYGQGFLFSPALPLDAVQQLVLLTD